MEAILRDEKTVLSVSTLISSYYGVNEVCLSVPAIVGRSGIEFALRLELDRAEEEQFRRSAAIVRDAIGQTRAG